MGKGSWFLSFASSPQILSLHWLSKKSGTSKIREAKGEREESGKGCPVIPMELVIVSSRFGGWGKLTFFFSGTLMDSLETSLGSLDCAFYNTGNDVFLKLATNISSPTSWESSSLLFQLGSLDTLLAEDINHYQCPQGSPQNILAPPLVFMNPILSATLSPSHPYSVILGHSFSSLGSFNLCPTLDNCDTHEAFQVFFVNLLFWSLEKITPLLQVEILSPPSNSLAYFQHSKVLHLQYLNSQNASYQQPESTCTYILGSFY